MNEPAVEVALRIPGRWANPGELMERLPEGCRMSPEGLVLPDGATVGFGAVAADTQFPEIFRSSCRQTPTDEELETVSNYTVNVFLSGPGGSLDAARMMMRAGVALVQAGGAGVFIDNSAMAHGGEAWIEMADDGGPDALSFAFVAIIHGKAEVWTMGMHVLGLRDLVMKRSDVKQGGFDIVEVIRYFAAGEKPIGNGHIIGDLDAPRFQAVFADSDPKLAGSPLHNPFGRMKLVSIRDVGEAN